MSNRRRSGVVATAARLRRTARWLEACGDHATAESIARIADLLECSL